jgi:peroxiredoxin
LQQVVDLQTDDEFRSMDLELLSIAPDPPAAWRREGGELGIELPMLSDDGNRVAGSYGIMRWAVSGEPGHTFVLIDADGRVAWVRDYGAPENGGFMYVVPEHLTKEIKAALSGRA